jgi:MFS family permease
MGRYVVRSAKQSRMNKADIPAAPPPVAATPSEPVVAGVYPPPLTAWLTVAILTLVYAVSYVDRTILTLLVGPVRESLQISDFELSLLHGFAFGIFYALMGIPISILADRASRKTIISYGIVAWAFMTAMCGFARSFAQMFLARVGVGVGEAALVPAAYSIMSDLFPREKLARPFSIFNFGSYIGSAAALVVGGVLIGLIPPLDLPVVGHLKSWQVVFLVVGLPGLLAAVLTMSMREPVRRDSAGTLARTVSWGDIKHVVRAERGAYVLLISGAAVFLMLSNGVSAWAPTFLIRSLHWTPAEVGLRYGLVYLACGSVGMISGGWLAVWMRTRGRRDGNLWVGVLAILALWPLGVVTPLLTNGASVLVGLGLMSFLISIPFGPAAAALQEITPNRMRARMSAIFMFTVNIAGIGAGPALVAFITDFVFHSDASIGRSLALSCGLVCPLAALLLWAACKPYRACVAALEQAARS